jgi:hypothetical protein
MRVEVGEWTDEMIELVERGARENDQLYNGIWVDPKSKENRPIPEVIEERLDELLGREKTVPVAEVAKGAGDSRPGASEDDIPF